MPFTTRHEQELAEIKALVHDLGPRVDELIERLDRIEVVQEHRRTRSVVEANRKSPLVAFVHIPKTAGGTVASIFTDAYSRAALDDAGNYFRSPEKTARKLTRRPGGWQRWHENGGRVTVGHAPYGLFRRHLPTDTRYMTFLREPVDRVLSHYHNHLRPTDPSTDERRRQKGAVVVASLEEALEMPQLNNLATRFLCGDPSPSGELGASALDDAKANLREFTFVGLQERFEESVVLLQRTLGFDSAAYVNRHVSIDRPDADEIPNEHRALIVECNRLDAELYSFAEGLFDDAVSAADEEFVGDVEKLRALSAAANSEALQKARAWFDRELPGGTTKSRDALFDAAGAADIPLAAVWHVSKLLALKKQPDDDGQMTWTRDETQVSQVGPGDHQSR